ncbi:MAG: alpha-ketoacid dehydrogenase subunit beta [Planctomycetota bacterium]|nr:alpha-ketoacid dehydrogenase subunit beta [Planctomycetota bacterium]
MSAITYIQAITDGMAEEMRRDENVFCLGQDIGTYGGAFRATKGLLEEFDRARCLDTPLSESAIIGASVGAALMGLRPIAEMQFADFVTGGFNMLVNFAAKVHYRWGPSVPMVVRLPTGGGTRGGPFHATNCEAWFTRVPGLKVVAPATVYDAKGLIKAAIRDDNPVLYFEHKFLYRRIKEELPRDDYIVPLGSARIAREGEDVSLITYGSMTYYGQSVADELEAQGVSVEVLDLRSLIPLDEAAILQTVRKTNRVVICHEDTKTGGFGGEISARIAELAFEHLDAPVRRVAAIDTPVPHAPQLEDAFMPQPEDIKNALMETLEY